MDIQAKGRTADLLVGLALLLLLAHAIVAVAIGLDLYADGGWFDFALMVGKPLKLVWRNYPARFTPYLFEFLPAYGLHRLHVPLSVALGVAHAVRNLAPAASLALCWRILPKDERAMALLPAAYFVLFGLLTWGFPTEVWLLPVFAWPAVLLFLYGPNSWTNAAWGGAAVIGTLFSHEAAIPLIPLLALAGALRWRDCPPRNAIVAILASAGGLIAWVIAKLTVEPDPIISYSVGYNAYQFFGVGALVGHQALSKYALILLTAALAFLAAGAWRRLTAPALAVLAAIGLWVVLRDFGVASMARYQVRSICLLALMGMIVALLAARQWPRLAASVPIPRPLRPFLIATALLMAGVIVEQDVRFALAWAHFDRVLTAAVNCDDRPAAACRPGGVIDLPAADVTSPGAWSWGAPFLAIVRSRNLQTSQMVRDHPGAGQPIQRGARARMVFSACKAIQGVVGPRLACRLEPFAALPPAPYFMPLSCADAQALTVDARRPPAMQALTQVVCSTPVWTGDPRTRIPFFLK